MHLINKLVEFFNFSQSCFILIIFSIKYYFLDNNLSKILFFISPKIFLGAF